MLPPSTDAALREQARAWRDEDPDPATRAELDALLATGDLRALGERFAGRLQFGTAGLRGALGAGPNRMNRALVRRATAGVAAWLRASGASGPVVVGRDARHGSAAFAEDTAAVLAGAGWAVRVLPDPLPTPVLAYSVRHLGAAAGIMITASHNPPQDNGYKLYLADGAQIVPPADAGISAAIDAVGPLAGVPLGTDGIEPVGDELVAAYVEAVRGLLSPSSPRDLRAVYTAMHGVGASVARRAFAAAGFPPLLEVAEQAEPDPDFPTVAFPNPEEPGALDLALALAAAAGADLVLAHDPDGDRLAVAVPARAGWRPLTGDELGVLLADHVLRTTAREPGDVVVTTIVSSSLLARLAEAVGVAHAEVLTGFKWVVRAPRPGQRFVFGYEEALGYCVGDVVRDKDGISAALVAAELVATLRAEGRTVQERLDELHRRHGVHHTAARSWRLAGADWLACVTAAMAAARAAPPVELAGRAVAGVEDLLAPGSPLPPSDVLVWHLDGGRVVIRPSGTEPKLKAYAEAVVPVPEGGDLEAARTAAAAVAGAFLDAVGSRLPDL
jgi:phosphomannomutase